MTHQEMHDLADLLLDKAGAPWFDATEKDKFLNLAMMEYVKNTYKEIEVNEKRRKDLLTLETRASYSNSLGIPSLDLPNANFPSLLFILAVELRFNKTCGGVSSTIDRYAVPRQWNAHYRNKRNSFLKGTDEYPVYTEQAGSISGSTITFHSTTAPIKVEMVYLKTPTVINAVSSPTGTCVLPAHTHEEIVNLAVRKMMATIADDRLPAHINEINNQE